MSPAETPQVSSVVAVYPDHASAECAVRTLHENGFALGDLSTAQILLPPGLTTLGTQFWADSGTVAFAAAAPFAAVLIVLALLATYVLMSRFGRVRTHGEA